MGALRDLAVQGGPHRRSGRRHAGRRSGRSGLGARVALGMVLLAGLMVAAVRVAGASFAPVAAGGLSGALRGAGDGGEGGSGQAAAPGQGVAVQEASGPLAGAGAWRLEIWSADGGPLDAAWAWGRDASGRWLPLDGRREGDAWVFLIPMGAGFTQVRFGRDEPAPPAAGTEPGPGGAAVAWRVTWQDGAGRQGEVPAGIVRPPQPRWLPPDDGPAGWAPGPGGPGLDPHEVERPRWSPPAASPGQERRREEPGPSQDAGPAGSRGPVAPPAGQGILGLPPGIPAFEVTLPTFRTTKWQPIERGHVLWRWSFGDGTSWVDPLPGHAIVRQPHRFARPGSYAVEATSYDRTGRPLIRYRWQVVIPPAEVVARAAGAAIPGPVDDAVLAAAQEMARWRFFNAAAPQAPRVVLRLEGPAHWVTGRPALFRLHADIENPPFTQRVEVDYDPGPVFSVRWRRPGTFAVDGAVRVRVHYRIYGRALALSHVYRVQRQVVVHALHLEE
ncbi:hypothetical protein [Thermaerobacter litoralis]